MNRKKFRELLTLTRSIIKALTNSDSLAQKTDSERAQQRIFNQLIELIKMEFSDCRAQYLSEKSVVDFSLAHQVHDAVSMSHDFLEPKLEETVQVVKSNSELNKPFKYVDSADTQVTDKPRKSIRDFSSEAGVTADKASSTSLPSIKLTVSLLVILLSLTGWYFFGSNLWPATEEESIDVSRINFSRPGKSDISPTLSQKSVITESQLLDLATNELASGNLKAAREYLRLVVTRNPTNKAAREQLKKLNEQVDDLENQTQQ